jgi:lycopene cyclase domain-containing protein
MHHFVYALLDIGTLLAAIIVSLCYRLPWLRQPARTGMVIAATTLPFIIWDIAASHAGHWYFNEYYTVGVQLAGLPIEEWGFFIVVPLACIMLWELLARIANAAHAWRYNKLYVLMWTVAALCLVTGGIAGQGRVYSILVATVALAVCVYLHFHAQLMTARWAAYQIMLLGLFFAFNSVLTALPVVSYSPDAVSGIRIGTIPIEDFFYNFVLINLVVIGYAYCSRSKPIT